MPGSSKLPIPYTPHSLYIYGPSKAKLPRGLLRDIRGARYRTCNPRGPPPPPSFPRSPPPTKKKLAKSTHLYPGKRNASNIKKRETIPP